MGPSITPERLLKQAQAFAGRHRRSVIASVVVALGGFGVTAFGIAPLAPDAALLPQRLITQAVTPDDVQTQSDALADLKLELLRHDITRGTDTPQSLLARLGVTDDAAARFLRNDPIARRIVGGRGGKMVQVRASDSGELAELVVRFPAENADQARTHFTRLTVKRNGKGFSSHVETAPLAVQVRLGSGTIQSSLFAATDAALLPDAVAIQIADIFSAEIDFHRELRKGDTFSVVYEALAADGEVVSWNEGVGRVLGAEFVNRGQAYQALWFNPGSKGGYYDGQGRSLRRSFLASPMEFSRVTSGFAMRLHPILNTWRAHKGVDYGAPTGAPVRTVADGVVDLAGRQNGYGNVIQVQHGNGRATLYAHLSRIDVKKGQRVEQGQRIGAVGATGWATGPHLHFEFKLNGTQQDPLRVARAAEQVTLDAAARSRLAQLSQGLRAQLQLAEARAARPSFE
ncbi:peptidase M23 [Rubrivivax gelatinosus]|uniref:M23 family metallopeptidase n=1 Tax=Rubrivivax gelatinosus TaxID=28068 RepID=UPI001905A097|nr:M23 family metallopeptidase [Rubrivivax gelatinosus]MBK1613736.1 peptidase M23 [Rubrivivax gelatinosus]